MAKAAANRTRMKAPAVPNAVPQTREAVVEAILKIGESQRQRNRIEANMNDEIAATKSRFELSAEPLNAEIKQLRHGVQIWCEANRDSITDGRKVKTVTFASGEVKWRMTPSSVKLPRKIEAVLAKLKELGLQRFIRTKEEVNKEAVLAEPTAISSVPGIKIEQTEEFVIEPFETHLEEVA